MTKPPIQFDSSGHAAVWPWWAWQCWRCWNPGSTWMQTCRWKPKSTNHFFVSLIVQVCDSFWALPPRILIFWLGLLWRKVGEFWWKKLVGVLLGCNGFLTLYVRKRGARLLGHFALPSASEIRSDDPGPGHINKKFQRWTRTVHHWNFSLMFWALTGSSRALVCSPLLKKVCVLSQVIDGFLG